MSRLNLLFMVWSGAIIVALFAVPNPYGAWLLVALTLGGAAVNAWQAWQEHRLVTRAPVVARLRRNWDQLYFLGLAAVFALLFVRITVTLSAAPEASAQYMPWLVFALLLFTLPMGLSSNKITEAGLVVQGTLLSWESIKSPQWIRGKPSTLSMGIEIDGKFVNGRWKFHRADVELVSAALTRYAGYSPITGS